MLIPIPLVGPSNTDREVKVSNELSRNLYPVVDQFGRVLVSQNSIPGSKSFAVPTPGAHRGFHKFSVSETENVLFTVNNQVLYKINESGGVTEIGVIAGANRCIYSVNGEEGEILTITTGGNTYQWDSVNGLVLNTSPNIISPRSNATIKSQTLYDGQFGAVKVSDIDTPGVIGGLSYFTAETDPDSSLRVFKHLQNAWVFGSSSIEPHYFADSGNWKLIQNRDIPHGLGAIYSVASTDERIYFLDDTRTPRAIIGGVAQDIGTPALGAEIEGYARTDDAIGFTFEWDQERFYALVFPAANKTKCLHEKSEWWFDLSSGTNGGRHRANDYVRAFNKHLIADYQTGEIFEWDFATYTDDGSTLLRRRETVDIHAGMEPMNRPGRTLELNKLIIECSVGQGTATGQGSDPKLMIRQSTNSGRRWESEITRGLGVLGDYNKRIEVDLAGNVDTVKFQLSVSDPANFTLVSASLDATLGLQ